MSKKLCAGALKKVINGDTVYLEKSWDLVHGKGWFVQIYTAKYKIGFGFHKTNKFSAYRMAIESLKNI